MASLFGRGPSKVSNKQRKGDASRAFGKFGRAIRAKVMGVQESQYDEEVTAAMQKLKTTKSEVQSIISGARGMIEANAVAQTSSEHLVTALLGAEASGDARGPWGDTAKNFGGVLTSVQQHSESYWARITILVDQLTQFFDEDILAANTLKDEYKQAKYEYDEAETGVNKATNEKRPEKERIRNEKRTTAEQVRVRLLDLVNALEERKNREMTGILREYFEALKEYHEACQRSCSQPLNPGVPGGGGGRGSYVFGSASADGAASPNPFTGGSEAKSSEAIEDTPIVPMDNNYGSYGGTDAVAAPSYQEEAVGMPPPSFGQAAAGNEYGANDSGAQPETNPFGDFSNAGSGGALPPPGPPPGGEGGYQNGQGAQPPPPAPQGQTNPFEQFN